MPIQVLWKLTLRVGSPRDSGGVTAMKESVGADQLPAGEGAGWGRESTWGA